MAKPPVTNKPPLGRLRHPIWPYEPYIRLKPERRPRSMTLCITAIAGGGKYLVGITDRMVSLALSIDDGIHKAAKFHDEWIALLSANDITDFVPLIDRAKRLFSERPNTLRDATDAMSEAYREERTERAVRRILSPYGISMLDFLQNGKQWFTPGERAEIRQSIEGEVVDCEVLASGFDDAGNPHIFTMAHPGVGTNFDKPGFWAIGSGGAAAMTLLAFLGQNAETPLSQAIYNVCAAKFFGEKAMGVGQETFFFVREEGSFANVLPGNFIPFLRETWERDGKPRPSRAAIEQIDAWAKEGLVSCLSVDKQTGKVIIPPALSSPTEP